MMTKRYIIEGKIHETAPVDRRSDKNYVESVRDWCVPVLYDEGAALNAIYARALVLRAELQRHEQSLFDAGVENYCYITGVLRRGPQGENQR